MTKIHILVTLWRKKSPSYRGIGKVLGMLVKEVIQTGNPFQSTTSFLIYQVSTKKFLAFINRIFKISLHAT